MAKGNFNFNRLKDAYIFPVIEKKVEDIKSCNPNIDLLNMGIGDIASPLSAYVGSVLQQAVEEMKSGNKLYGYGPSEGYSFLRNIIHEKIYANYPITPEDVFISDGINSDILNILDLFDSSCSVAIPNPAYPAYLNANVLLGRQNSVYLMPCTLETGFVPTPPKTRCDIVYLCSPHNPTGVAMNKQQLESFVNYALENSSILLVDGAYEAFITSPNTPRSIYEIPGAEKVAIEFRSFSKTAGFTGLRCSYTVVPQLIKARFGKKNLPLNPLWRKRQSIRFNGVAYPIQKAAEACFSAQGSLEIQAQVSSYLEQAKLLKESLLLANQTCFGGVDSPYIWWKAKDGTSSWDFFSLLLDKCQIISVPGIGFGKYGEGYVRLSAFNKKDLILKASQRINQLVY